MGKCSAFTATERKRSCLITECDVRWVCVWCGRYFQMDTRLFTSIIKISNRHILMAKWFTSSRRLEPLKPPTLTIYKCLSSRMARLKSTSLMEPNKSSKNAWILVFQMERSSVSFQTGKKKAFSRMARSSELRNQGLSQSNTPMARR